MKTREGTGGINDATSPVLVSDAESARRVPGLRR
jgi:hypothetical protein